MSLRLEMLQVARLAPALLGEAADLVHDFILSKHLPDGGFADRDGESDLYYSSFAVDGLMALQVPVPEEKLVPWLQRFGDGEGLDFVHLCCLARLWSAMTTVKVEPEVLDGLLGRIEEYRTPDGGYNQTRRDEEGSAYGCFLAWGAWSDHKRRPPNEMAMKSCLDSLQVGDGSWSNDPGMPVGMGPATAAAVSLSRNLRIPIPEETGKWLLGCFHPQGGFLAFPGVPMPDLLSTSVVLHALDGLQVPLDAIKEPCLDFVDTLWSADGGFHGNWSDDDLDLEYTYYGLLALGHLSL